MINIIKKELIKPIDLNELSKMDKVLVDKEDGLNFGFKNGKAVMTHHFIRRIYFIGNNKKIDIKTYDGDDGSKIAERRETPEQVLREINNLILEDDTAKLTGLYRADKLRGHHTCTPSKKQCSVKVDFRKML